MVYLTPLEVVDTYSRIATVYDQVYCYHKSDIEQFVEIASPKDGENVLDLGTGSAWVAIAVKKHVGKGLVVGVDVTEGMLLTAARNLRNASISNPPGMDPAKSILLLPGDITAEATMCQVSSMFPAFNLITCEWVFSNISPPQQETSLRMWTKLLVPGGRLVVERHHEGECPAVFVKSRCHNPDRPQQEQIWEPVQSIRMAPDSAWAECENQFKSQAERCGLRVESMHWAHRDQVDISKVSELQNALLQRWKKEGRQGEPEAEFVRSFMKECCEKWQAQARKQNMKGDWKFVSVVAVLMPCTSTMEKTC